MKKLTLSASALALGIACAFPAFAQTTAAPAGASTQSSTSDTAGNAYGVPPSTPTPSAGTDTSASSGTPVTTTTPSVAATPSTAPAPDTTMATASPSAPSISADAAGTSTPPATQAMGAGPDMDDDGPDMGWLGLFGLLGLLGLRRKHVEVDHRVRPVQTPTR